MNDNPVQSVKKAFDLFGMLVFDDTARNGMMLTELAARMGLRANTTHNLLKSMMLSGFVAQNDAGRYVAGPKCRAIGQWNQLTAEATQRVLRAQGEALCARLGEAVIFVTLVQGRRVPLFHLDPARAIKVDVSALPDASFYAVPTGRILTAYATPDELAVIVATWGMPGAYWDDIRDAAQLDAACAALRATGHSTQAPDVHELFATASPVFDASGRLLGALGCYAPIFRCDPAQQTQIRQALQEAASAIAATLATQG